MKEKRSSKNKSLIIFTLIISLLSVFFSYHLLLEQKNDKRYIIELSEKVKDIENSNLHSINFKNSSEFNAAVIKSINEFIKKKQTENLNIKYKQFDLASDTHLKIHLYGKNNTRFTLVEFSDLECPYCKYYHHTLKKIIDDNKEIINWKWLHLPLNFHNPIAHKEAIASECIAQLKGNRAFWVFITDIFQKTQSNGRGVNNLSKVVSDLGVNRNEFNKCFLSGKYENLIQNNINMANKLGINGTPATLIIDNDTGNKQLVSGALPESSLLSIIHKLMNP